MPAPQSKLACDVLLDLDTAGPGPLHERLTRALRTAIRDGVLAPDSALPPSRALAADLGCSRWVVTQAYEQLIAEGYLAGRTGSATRIRRLDPQDRPADVPEGRRQVRPELPTPRYDLAPGLPDLREFPRRRWADAIQSQLTTLPHTELGYPERSGAPRLREVLAAYLRRVRGADAQPADVTVTSSVTSGVTALCRVLRARGINRIAVEDPGWTRLRQAVADLGVELVGIPVDADGLVVDALVRQPDVRAVLLTPAHQFPTGAVLAPERRAALLAWVRGVDGVILEDDYDAEFRYDRRPVGTLQGVEPRHVALFGSLSKTLSPALGIGWMVTPRAWTSMLRDDTKALPSPPLLDQLAFTQFLESGGYDRHLRASRQRYRRRRDALVGAIGTQLPDSTLSGAAAGLHLVLQLDPATPADAVVTGAAAAGVKVADLDTYRLSPDPSAPALVLGYGNLPDGAVHPAVSRLAEAVRSARSSVMS
ncbi:PLP-dependent aminotransferase family protein [Actinopolymorpha alba]|uniref:MocR-like pyridoxine biosynthesis transcription factor PdxR n=1 Tax=Actinopolymorpha alba TaxID=533267 RepID=UPI00192CDF9C|nr:PLP-dependent aminotransferase family protein [Actinopolymorpha alba]